MIENGAEAKRCGISKAKNPMGFSMRGLAVQRITTRSPSCVVKSPKELVRDLARIAGHIRAETIYTKNIVDGNRWRNRVKGGGHLTGLVRRNAPNTSLDLDRGENISNRLYLVTFVAALKRTCHDLLPSRF